MRDYPHAPFIYCFSKVKNRMPPMSCTHTPVAGLMGQHRKLEEALDSKF